MSPDKPERILGVSWDVTDAGLPGRAPPRPAVATARCLARRRHGGGRDRRAAQRRQRAQQPRRFGGAVAVAVARLARRQRATHRLADRASKARTWPGSSAATNAASKCPATWRSSAKTSSAENQRLLSEADAIVGARRTHPQHRRRPADLCAPRRRDRSRSTLAELLDSAVAIHFAELTRRHRCAANTSRSRP